MASGKLWPGHGFPLRQGGCKWQGGGPPPPRWGGPRGVFITYLWGIYREFAIWIPGGKVLILPFLREPGWVSATGPEPGRAKEIRFIFALTSMSLLLATSAAEIFTNLRCRSFLEFLYVEAVMCTFDTTLKEPNTAVAGQEIMNGTQ